MRTKSGLSPLESGPLLWNVMNDDLETAANGALSTVQSWMEENGLHLSVLKTKAIMLTSKRAYSKPKFYLEGTELGLEEEIKYLGVTLCLRLGFKRHLETTSNKVTATNAALSRLMPNIGGPSQGKRRLLAAVAVGQAMYAAPVWSTALECYNKRKILEQPMRRVALRVASAYRTVSTQAIFSLGDTACRPTGSRAGPESQQQGGTGPSCEKERGKGSINDGMADKVGCGGHGTLDTPPNGTSASGPGDHTAMSTSTWCRCSPDTDASVGICTGSKGEKTRHASTAGTPETMWDMQYLNVIGGTGGGVIWRKGSPGR